MISIRHMWKNGRTLPEGVEQQDWHSEDFYERIEYLRKKFETMPFDLTVEEIDEIWFANDMIEDFNCDVGMDIQIAEYEGKSNEEIEEMKDCFISTIEHPIWKTYANGSFDVENYDNKTDNEKVVFWYPYYILENRVNLS